MYVCVCHGISEKRLHQAIEEGVCSFEQLQSCTGVATCCGACEPCARQVLGDRVATGRFGAHMHVSLTNDGPVTFWLQVTATT